MTFEGLSDGDLLAVKSLSKTSFMQAGGRPFSTTAQATARAYIQKAAISYLIPHKRSQTYSEEVKRQDMKIYAIA
jgi:hypothetical protein